MNLIELVERFPTNEACRQHLIAIRWPEGVKCPRCECGRVSELAARKQWTCLGCRYRFSATAGTIFHKSKIGLRKWFMAIFVVLNAKKGISSLELNRQLKISQECCWHMLHRIREAMREEGGELFSGIVQADECYHGGPPRKPAQKNPWGIDGRKTSKHMGNASDAQPVLGFYEVKSGRVRTEVIDDVKGATLQKAMEDDIDFANTDLHTDEHRSYNRIGKICRSHRVVQHSQRYVAADGTHTNHIENAWSLLARAVVGSFHYVSVKHLQRYLDEFDARFNARTVDAGVLFNSILKRADGRTLPRKRLSA